MACAELILEGIRLSGPIPSAWHFACIGGRPPEPVWMKKMLEKNPVSTWAADRGLESFAAVDYWPDHLLGDFDSLEPSDLLKRWETHKNQRALTFPVEKDLTDFQILLTEWGKKRAPDEGLVVTGFWGGRFDHAWGNVQSLLWALTQGWPAPLACDQRELLLVLQGGEEVTLDFETPPQAFSLLPLTPSCEDVITDGLYWKPEPTLLATFPYALSNKTTKRPVRVSLRKGWLGLYVCSQEAAIQKASASSR